LLRKREKGQGRPREEGGKEIDRRKAEEIRKTKNVEKGEAGNERKEER